MKGFRDGQGPARGARETFKQTYKKGCFIKKEKLPVTLPYLTPGCTVEAIELKAAGHVLWKGHTYEFQDVRVYVNTRGNESEPAQRKRAGAGYDGANNMSPEDQAIWHRLAWGVPRTRRPAFAEARGGSVRLIYLSGAQDARDAEIMRSAQDERGEHNGWVFVELASINESLLCGGEKILPEDYPPDFTPLFDE